MDNRQLEWVARNRKRRLPGEALGEVLKRLRRRAPLKVPAWRPRVAQVVVETTDAVFRGHAWVAGLRGGVVMIHVDDPSLVGVLRMQWHRVLADAFAVRLPDLGIIDVRFRYEVPPDAMRSTAENPVGDPEKEPPLWRARVRQAGNRDLTE